MKKVRNKMGGDASAADSGATKAFAGKWFFKRQSPGDPSGANLAEAGFTREDRQLPNIFSREFDQNVLDARCDDRHGGSGKAPAHIVMSLKQTGEVDEDFLHDILDPLEDHLNAAGHGPEVRNWKHHQVLVIEEFGTIGLTGVTDDAHVEGEAERWKNFFFGEASRTKTKAALGRQGQGKITYHISSGARTVLALTRREGETDDYLFGKCIFSQTHTVAGLHYTHHAYWPAQKTIHASDGREDIQPLPVSDPEVINKFKKAFGLKREKESGTSWVIPFVPDSFTGDALAREFVKDFFFSILRCRLTAEICGQRITDSNLRELLRKYAKEKKPGEHWPTEPFFGFMEEVVTRPESEKFTGVNVDGANGRQIGEEMFPPGDLARLREDFEDGRMISVRLPVQVQRKGEDAVPETSFIEVHLQLPEGCQETEELYVRSDLQIAEERHLKGKATAAFGIVMVDELPISEFLGYCEVASHLKWNANEPQANRLYKGVGTLLSTVRKSLPRLFRLLAGSDSSIVEDALADILSIPEAGPGRKPPPEPGPDPGPDVTPPGPSVPPAKLPEIFRYPEDNKDSAMWIVKPGKDVSGASFPRTETFEFAYNRLPGEGNAFSKYLPWDFDLADTEHDPAVARNVDVIKRSENTIEVTITDADFELRIPGFSDATPLVSRRVT